MKSIPPKLTRWLTSLALLCLLGACLQSARGQAAGDEKQFEIDSLVGEIDAWSVQEKYEFRHMEARAFMAQLRAKNP